MYKQLSRRRIIPAVCAAAGITELIERLPRQKALMVLNYHRIGNAWESPYDPGVFSSTAEQFDLQIRHLKRRFSLVTLDEAVAMARGEAPVRTSILITFDDGYLDNYKQAFPILRSHGVQAVFFLPTSFIGTNYLPWWDAIAYLVRNSRTGVITLNYPQQTRFDVGQEGLDRVIMKILYLYKSSAMTDKERFIASLESACETSVPHQNSERHLMNWDEAREMLKGGMAFGSHTHTHEILSKLSVERQREEVGISREILETELNCQIGVLSYPVGGRHCFTPETIEVVKSIGYRAAFSFYGGFNRQGKVEPYNICRVAVDPQDEARFRFKVAVGALTGTDRVAKALA